MEAVKHPIGTRVRVNEEKDRRHGQEGVVIQHFFGVARGKQYTHLIEFDPDRDGSRCRWFHPDNLEVVDGDEGR